MKAVIGTMIGFLFLSFLVFPVVLGKTIWSGGGDLLPVYSGLLVLCGLIVVCTMIVLEKIEELKEKLNPKNIEK
ncbi:hypothetical protein RZN25_18410 [Bacillaceae bacterium S4-13-56]